MDGTVITTIEPESRDSFGQYSILPGHIHVFPFTVPLLGQLTVGYGHILPNSQDFSIDGWISREPIDDRVLGHFKLMRRRIDIQIFCSLLRADDDDTRIFLDSNRTYYVNIKNLQNARNAYELNFLLPSS